MLFDFFVGEKMKIRYITVFLSFLGLIMRISSIIMVGSPVSVFDAVFSLILFPLCMLIVGYSAGIDHARERAYKRESILISILERKINGDNIG